MGRSLGVIVSVAGREMPSESRERERRDKRLWPLMGFNVRSIREFARLYSSIIC